MIKIIYLIALFGSIGSLQALGPIEYALLQTEAKVSTLNEASPETDCEPDCIYKYPYLPSDDQEKLEPASIETIEPTYSQVPIQPEQDLSKIPEEGEERFILESENCYKFELKVEEEPAPKDEACYEIIVPPPTIVVVEPGLPEQIVSSPEAIPSTISPVIGELEGPIPETAPFVPQNQKLIPSPTEASEPYQSQEQPVPFNTVPESQEQEVLPILNPLNQEVSPPNQDQEIPLSINQQQAPSGETVPQTQEVILPLEEIREPSQAQEQPFTPFGTAPQLEEVGQEVLPVENTLAPQGQQEIPLPETIPSFADHEELPPIDNELQSPPPQGASFAPQDQQEIISEESIPQTVPFGPQNPEVILPLEETTEPYQAQEQPPLPFSAVPRLQEGQEILPSEVSPQSQEQIPLSNGNQEQPPVFSNPPVSQEQQLPPTENPLTSQDRDQGLPYQTQEEVPPPRDTAPLPSDESAAIPPTNECEVRTDNHPEIVVIVESPENVNIHYDDDYSSHDRPRANLGYRRQKQIPLQEGWGERYPIEETYNPSQHIQRVSDILPFEQESQVEPILIPEFEEGQFIRNEVGNGVGYADPQNRNGEIRQEDQEQIPFEAGQAIENSGQEIFGLPPRIPADFELPPYSGEESVEVERIPGEDYEGVYTSDQIISVKTVPLLPSSEEYKDVSELESFSPPSERPQDTFWQGGREQIPIEQGFKEATEYDQDISSLTPSLPINQQISSDVIEGPIENESIPIEEDQGVVHYDEEVYNQDEGSPLNPEFQPDLKKRANLRGYSPVNEIQGGNPQDQVESIAPLSQPEPYYGGENVEPFIESEIIPRPREEEFIPSEIQEIIDYDEEAYNVPQQYISLQNPLISPEIRREPNEATEYVYADKISTGMTQIYGQPTTYVTYETYDREIGHEVAFTYVLTNIYSGIFRTDDYHYVVYGAGALNFYNSYYGAQPEIQETPSCSCTCASQGQTFNYSFNLE